MRTAESRARAPTTGSPSERLVSRQGFAQAVVTAATHHRLGGSELGSTIGRWRRYGRRQGRLRCVRAAHGERGDYVTPGPVRPRCRNARVQEGTGVLPGPTVLVQNDCMPLFEYACRSCGQHFEYLTRADRTPSCPSCSGIELEKQLSVFAVSAGTSSRPGSTPPQGSCGMCGDPRGPGACSVN